MRVDDSSDDEEYLSSGSSTDEKEDSDSEFDPELSRNMECEKRPIRRCRHKQPTKSRSDRKEQSGRQNIKAFRCSEANCKSVFVSNLKYRLDIHMKNVHSSKEGPGERL